MDPLRQALLERLIDHAALFPPASMTMPDALAEDRAARASDYAWMLDRFVCPASRLDELDGLDAPLSVVVDGELPAQADALELRLAEPRPNSARAAAHRAGARGRSAPSSTSSCVLGERWRDTVPAAVGRDRRRGRAGEAALRRRASCRAPSRWRSC